MSSRSVPRDGRGRPETPAGTFKLTKDQTLQNNSSASTPRLSHSPAIEQPKKYSQTRDANLPHPVSKMQPGHSALVSMAHFSVF